MGDTRAQEGVLAQNRKESRPCRINLDPLQVRHGQEQRSWATVRGDTISVVSRQSFSALPVPFYKLIDSNSLMIPTHGLKHWSFQVALGLYDPS